MDARLASAQTALNEGRGYDAILPLIELIEADPNQSASVYRTLLMQLYLSGKLEAGIAWGEAAIKLYPRDIDILNVLGVIYRRLSRYRDAIRVLDQAAKINPNNVAVQSNRGNVLIDMGDGVRAEAVFAKLIRADPSNAEFLRQAGRALLRQGKKGPALSRFRQAVALKSTLVEAWLDIIGVEHDQQNNPAAEIDIARALAANPNHPRLLEAQAIVYRGTQQFHRADAFL